MGSKVSVQLMKNNVSWLINFVYIISMAVLSKQAIASGGVVLVGYD